MAVKAETSLQERIQKFIVKSGGYVIKQHGDMISEPGVPDLLVCYRGIFIGLEVKVDNNVPSKRQGIHCRRIWNAGGIAAIVRSVDEVHCLLLFINRWIEAECQTPEVIRGVEAQMIFMNIDTGRSW